MITLYTTHCPKCLMVKKQLDATEINYVEEDNIEVMREKGLQGTAPQLGLEDGTILTNFADIWR